VKLIKKGESAGEKPRTLLFLCRDKIDAHGIRDVFSSPGTQKTVILTYKICNKNDIPWRKEKTGETK
jgi:hypothetical protein